MTHDALNAPKTLDSSVPLEPAPDSPDIPGFFNAFTEKFSDALAPDVNSPEWKRVQESNAALKRYARTDEFKVKLGDLNGLIDQADLEAEGHGMSNDLSKLIDEMSEITGELKGIIAS